MVRRRIQVRDERKFPFVPLDPSYLLGNAARVGPAAVGVLAVLSLLDREPGTPREVLEGELARVLGTDARTVSAATARLEHWGLVGPELEIRPNVWADC